MRLAVARDPAALAPVTWGGRLAAVQVDLRRVDGATLRDLLMDAWAAKRAKSRA